MAPGQTKIPPIRFSPLAASSSSSSIDPPPVESTAGMLKETPSSSATTDVVATLDTCIVLDVPAAPFFWQPPVSLR